MISNSLYVNDGSSRSPRLCVYMNLDNLVDLGASSVWPGHKGPARYEKLLADGFEGVQLTRDDPPIVGMPFPYCGLSRVNTPEEAEPIATKHSARGDLCLTVHVGWGMEDDDEAFRLVEAILAASARHSLPIFIETHRATITQDLWRTVQIVKRFPEIRFNGDFSHYYCGQEMVYGDWPAKLAFIEPILARVGFIHGRIASPGCMQVPIDADFASRPLQAHGSVDYLAHFKELWTCALTGFLRAADRGDVLIFAPELLTPIHYYARMFPQINGQLAEESDRYAQALLLKDLARICFTQATQSISAEKATRKECDH